VDDVKHGTWSRVAEIRGTDRCWHRSADHALFVLAQRADGRMERKICDFFDMFERDVAQGSS
jgi:hypothetical protein